MSQQPDKHQKTEKPTQKRIRDARKEGNIPRSQELGTAASLLMIAGGVRLFVPMMGNTWIETTSTVLSGSHEFVDDPLPAMATSAGMLLATLAPILVAAVLAGIAVGVAQTGFSISTKAAKPKLNKLDPRKALEKFKPGNAAWEVARTSAKLFLLAAVCAGPIQQWMDAIRGTRDLIAGLEAAAVAAVAMLWRAAALAVVIGGADYAYQRWKWFKNLKMSREELKREHKDSEGDPLLRQARRSRQQQLSRNAMIGAVATADVVVVNPTHFAVALAYQPGDAAPKVVARGADHLAAKIRKAASKHGVYIASDPPLARALYRSTRVGQHVPPAMYEAVAALLAVAYRRRRRGVM